MARPFQPILAVLLIGLALAGCGGRPAGEVPAYPGHLRLPSEVPADFMLRQHLVARYGDEESAFDLVLQKRGDELVLLGLAPYGGRAFALTQRGDTFESEKFVPMRLPFPARHILNDIHRVLFRGSGLGAQRPDGDHVLEEHGERVEEGWQDGQLVTRTYERLDGEPAGRIRITYEGAIPPDGVTAPKIHLHNGWFDYELHIDNLEQRRL
jgi:hypothetical protein